MRASCNLTDNGPIAFMAHRQGLASPVPGAVGVSTTYTLSGSQAASVLSRYAMRPQQSSEVMVPNICRRLIYPEKLNFSKERFESTDAGQQPRRLHLPPHTPKYTLCNRLAPIRIETLTFSIQPLSLSLMSCSNQASDCTMREQQ